MRYNKQNSEIRVAFLEARGSLFRELEMRRIDFMDPRLHSKGNLGLKETARLLLGMLSWG